MHVVYLYSVGCLCMVNELFRGSKPIIGPVQAIEKKKSLWLLYVRIAHSLSLRQIPVTVSLCAWEVLFNLNQSLNQITRLGPCHGGIWWIRPTAYSPHKDVIDSPQRHGIGRLVQFNFLWIWLYRKPGSTDWHLDTRSPAARNRRRDYLCIARKRRQDICVSVWECHNISFFGTINIPYLSNTLKHSLYHLYKLCRGRIRWASLLTCME
jgi:hypothetical protein